MSPVQVAIASQNPVKIKAAQAAFQRAFPEREHVFEALSVDSGVPEQPMSDAQTRQGAINRVNNLRAIRTGADLCIAFEGGYDRIEQQPVTFAYAAINDNNQLWVGRSSTLPLPALIADALEAGDELGPIMDRIFNKNNVKQNEGAIGILTNGMLNRTALYRDTLTLLLAPYLHPELYKKHS